MHVLTLGRAASAAIVVFAGLVGPASAATGTLLSAARPTLPTSVTEIDASEGATATSQIPIPSGITPTEVRGTLRLDDPSATAVVLLGGASVFTGTGKRIYDLDLQVPHGSVSEGQLPITVRYLSGDSADACRTVDAQARLTAIAVTYTGVESTPTSLATFFPVVAPQVNVSVDPGGSDDVLEAALVAVGAISHRYGSPTKVTFNGDAGAAPGTRRIAIAAGPDPVRAAISDDGGVPTLTLTGSGRQLSEAAAYLGAADPVRLLDSVEASGPAVTTTPSPAPLQQTLQHVAGTDQLALSGYGSSQAYVGINQDAFGGPIDSLRLHLPFTNTAVPSGSTAQLDVFFNNHLMWSRDLGAGDGYSVAADFTVNASDLNRSNGLVVRLSATASVGHCLSGPLALPLEVHLSTADATMTASRGFGALSGFQRFPQVLAGSLAVALRSTGADRMTNAAAAAAIISALQQVSSTQLRIHLVTPDAFVNGHDTGLLVGATGTDANALHAPLRLVSNRLLGNANTEYEASNDQPFAALEAIARSDRDVLLLGGWNPGSTSGEMLTSRLTRYLTITGWSGLTDDLVVATLHQQPFTISSGAYVPSAAQLAEHGRAAYWLFLGALVLVLLLGLNYALARRRRRAIAEIVDAQERADAAEAD
ncbi:hypothetical protein Back2_03370 [Nocardioides baekrokdamisoli]|uniref:Cellulose synthase n=1 Tax=Nocardioides baekrokdamisoli TaxID=1804624 RepID=A0A3G9IB79_9ACTN|nr:hypothetical protein [Nocardioides baekrokdamisoli]BBH16050.1 hypothetical protein Back2_03370 [Nocardioides baekrokdamisoli]